jgi:signal recognition particle subunit SEC65
MIVSQFGYKCTQEEAKKYPQFRWVALEELWTN